MAMVNLDDMLFEVSSEIRLRILESLMNGPATVTDISNQLDVSMTEASRHFNRLSQVGLIKKNPDRDYSITILGKTVLTQLGPLEFITRHSDYFDSHDATRIPVKFLNRINELADAVPTYTQRANIIRSVEKMKNISLEAEEYYNSILDNSSMKLVLYAEPDDESTNFMKNKVESGIRFRALFPMGVETDKIPQESLRGFIELHRSGNFEFRIIERTDLFLHMNEKEVSLLAFPDMNDKFDYLGFEATDDRTINWCNEVFNHYWNSSKPFF
jgi:predicted transcriptional regulator